MLLIFVSSVLLTLPPISVSISTADHIYPSALNRTHRLLTQDGGANNDLASYDRLGSAIHPWGNYAAAADNNLNPKLGVSQRTHANHYTNKENSKPAEHIRPVIDRSYDHAGKNLQNYDRYNVDSDHADGFNGQYYQSSGQFESSHDLGYHEQQGHPHHHPQRPILVAVKTTEDHDPLAKLGLLTVLKLIFAKFKTFLIIKLGIFFLFLIKIPFVLLKIALKLLVILKFTKLFKLVLIPSLIPLVLLPLLPLLLLLFLPLLLVPLAPLLFIPVLLPLLIPLLLLLPVPIFAQRPWPPPFRPPPGPDGPDPDEDGGRARSMDELIALTRRVMESQQCMEKLGCDIAGSQTPGVLSGTVTRLLEVLQWLAPEGIVARVRSYTEAFKLGASEKRSCEEVFLCSPPPGLMSSLNFKM